MNEKKNTCQGCAYRLDVPGNTHSSCCFDWEKSEIQKPRGHHHGIEKGWFAFPYNYDPIWMISECKAFSIEKDEKMVRRFSPAEQLLGML